VRSQNKKFKSLRGIGTVRQVSGNWQVQLPVEGKTEVFEFAAAEAPPGARPGKWQVNISARGDRWQGISPITGSFKVEFVKFVGRGKPGEPPKPIYDPGGPKQGPNGEFNADPSFSMMAVYRIVDGPNKGMEIIHFLPYIYEEDDTDGQAMHYGTKTQNDKVEQFESAWGLTAKDKLPFSDNLLPALQALFLKRSNTAEVVLVDGKVKGFAGDEDAEDELVEVKPARKSRK